MFFLSSSSTRTRKGAGSWNHTTRERNTLLIYPINQSINRCTLLFNGLLLGTLRCITCTWQDRHRSDRDLWDALFVWHMYNSLPKGVVSMSLRSVSPWCMATNVVTLLDHTMLLEYTEYVWNIPRCLDNILVVLSISNVSPVLTTIPFTLGDAAPHHSCT
jgi:hypothetical protein